MNKRILATIIPEIDELRAHWEEPLIKHCKDTLKKL